MNVQTPYEVRPMPKKREEVKTVRLSINVDETTWKRLRNAAEVERDERGRASVNALVNRLIQEYLAKRGGK